MAFLPVKQYAYEEREKYEKGGVYCFYPFDNKLNEEDGEHYGVFKVGISTYVHNRLYSYHTALPAGFHLIAYLKSPTKKRTQPTDLQYYKMIEDDIHKTLGDPLFINTRKNQGKTEWFYTSIEKIERAFKKAKRKYGGELEDYDLVDLPLKIKNRVKFTGRINFY